MKTIRETWQRNYKSRNKMFYCKSISIKHNRKRQNRKKSGFDICMASPKWIWFRNPKEEKEQPIVCVFDITKQPHVLH